MRSAPARPVNGQRRTTVPSSTANGAIRASIENAPRSPRRTSSKRRARTPPSPRAPSTCTARRDPQRARIRGPRMRELQRDEREERDGCGVAAHPAGPLEHRPRLAPSELEEPDGEVRNRPPRAEDAPDVPEQDREQRDPEPEDHVDERRREVQELDRRPEERRRERQDEESGRERTEHDANDTGKHDGRDPVRERRPSACASSSGRRQRKKRRTNETTRTTAAPTKK